MGKQVFSGGLTKIGVLSRNVRGTTKDGHSLLPVKRSLFLRVEFANTRGKLRLNCSGSLALDFFMRILNTAPLLRAHTFT